MNYEIIDSRFELQVHYDIYHDNLDSRIEFQPEIIILFTSKLGDAKEYGKLKMLETSEYCFNKFERNFFLMITITRK